MKTDFEKYLSIIERAPLFEGLSASETAELLEAVGADIVSREDGASFIQQDEETGDIFVLLSGSAAGERLIASGALKVVNVFFPGGEFGDMLSGAREKSPVTVRARGRAAALRLSFDSLLSARSAESARARVVRSLISIAAGKYFALSRRVALLTEPRLCRRIALLLLPLFDEAASDEISLPYDREGMAAYLGCERSALSRALSRLKRAGAIDYKENRFRLLRRELLNDELL